MPKQSFVELESGEQHYFDQVYDAFKFAKAQEELERNSVALVAVGDDYQAADDELIFFMDQVTIYRGQRLRHLIRTIDNVSTWIRTQIEQTNAEEDSDSS